MTSTAPTAAPPSHVRWTVADCPSGATSVDDVVSPRSSHDHPRCSNTPRSTTWAHMSSAVVPRSWAARACEVAGAVHHALEQVGVDVGPGPAVGQGDGGGGEAVAARVAAAPHPDVGLRGRPARRAGACPTGRSRRRGGRGRTRGPRAGASPTTLGRSRWSASGSAASVASRSTTLGARNAVVDADEVVGAGATVVDDRGASRRRRCVGLGHDGHHPHARGGRRGGQLGDLRHVVGPRQRPLHEQQGVEAWGRSRSGRRPAPGSTASTGTQDRGGAACARRLSSPVRLRPARLTRASGRSYVARVCLPAAKPV